MPSTSGATVRRVTVERKSFPLTGVKASRSEPGVFDALVAVFGNVDHGGDRIVPGAFTRTLEERGMPPVVWSHQWMVPPIGKTLDARETDRGLEIRAKLFVDEDDGHDTARQVYVAMREGALREFSFAYTTRESRFVEEDGNTVRELHDLDLLEVGPTLVGMNPETELIAAPKSLNAATMIAFLEELKAGARNSAKDAERLQEIHDLSVANGAVCEGKSATVEQPEPGRIAELLSARPVIVTG